MLSITLSDAAFEKLKTLAEPLVDTAESVITSLIDAEVDRRGISANGNGKVWSTKDHALRLNPDAHENLKHTRLISATVDSQPIHRPKWNSLHEHIHVLGHKRLGSFEHLCQASGANLQQGRYEENGYKYVPEADLSIQGVDSNLAWNHSLGLARELRMPIKVTFEWRNKDGASRPGETGVLEWTPTES